MRSKMIAAIKPRPKGVPRDGNYPGAFLVVSLTGPYAGDQILCRDCALGYVESERYEVRPATYKEVSDALLRINDIAIGRVGPHGEGKTEACYECEEEL